MLKKLCAAFLSLFFLFALPAGRAAALDLPQPQPLDTGMPALNANAVILYSVDADQLIYEKNADERIHPASTTKILSVALAMELCDDLEGTIVTVPEGVWGEFQGMDISHANLKVGEQLTMKDLLYCMMLQSANEASVALAAHYGRDNFIQMMNDKATELGCTGSRFSNPHGAFVENHYTTARDMLIITQWAMEIPGFWEMSQQSRYLRPATNLGGNEWLATTILMQDPYNATYYEPYIKGIKTGTLEASGRCFISAAQQDGATYLCLVFGAPRDTELNESFVVTKTICDWAFATLDLVNVVDPTTAVTEIKLRHASGRDSLLLYPDGELLAIHNINNEETAGVQYEFDVPDRVKAPVEAGDVIGTADAYYDGRYVGQVNLVSRETVARSGFVLLIDTLGDILWSIPAKIIYVLLLLVVLAYLFLLVPYARKQEKKRKQKRR